MLLKLEQYTLLILFLGLVNVCVRDNGKGECFLCSRPRLGKIISVYFMKLNQGVSTSILQGFFVITTHEALEIGFEFL